jgi:hypothetical protein
MIVAIEGLIPDRNTDRRAGSAQNKSAPPPVHPQIDTAAWLREQQGKTPSPHPGPDPVRDDDGLGVPPDEAADAPAYSSPNPGPHFDSSESILARPSSPSETTPSAHHAAVSASAPNNRVPSSIEKKPDTWRLRL